MSADLDKQIDRAVREMLDVEPRADLHARVMARLSASSSRLPASSSQLPASSSQLPASGSLFDFVASGFSRNRVIFAAAAAALILLAVFVARRNEPASQALVIAQRADQRLPLETARPDISSPQGPAQRRDLEPIEAAPRAPNRGAAGERTVQATDSGDVQVASDIEPLTSIAPITVARIEQDLIAPAAVTVRPLDTIAEIQIARLTPADRRN